MIIVDTSILIGYFKGKNEYPFNEMDKIIDDNIPYGINDLIYQEMLQGSRDEGEYEILKEYLNTLPFYELKFGKRSYENAALMNMKCRKNGITIRSTMDLIIAETAIENNLYILHEDNDYRNMSKIIKEMKLYNK
jgi:predicted nucleic acid-binding protein